MKKNVALMKNFKMVNVSANPAMSKITAPACLNLPAIAVRTLSMVNVSVNPASIPTITPVLMVTRFLAKTTLVLTGIANATKAMNLIVMVIASPSRVLAQVIKSLRMASVCVNHTLTSSEKLTMRIGVNLVQTTVAHTGLANALKMLRCLMAIAGGASATMTMNVQHPITVKME